MLWYDQLTPVTSLLLDLNGFANSVVLELVCGLSLPGSHFQKEKGLTAWCTEAPLPPRVLRDIPDETVKTIVSCLVPTAFREVLGKEEVSRSGGLIPFNLDFRRKSVWFRQARRPPTTSMWQSGEICQAFYTEAFMSYCHA